MLLKVKPRFDSASAISKGTRDYQQDAVIADFSLGSELGLVVLSDGMGGHAAGDVASKIVMTEVFTDLKFKSGNADALGRDLGHHLEEAAISANDLVRDYVIENPSAAGMGATLVATVFWERYLHWVSVGDSPLYLFRGNRLIQVNEDHSLAPQIDYLVESGLMEPEEGRNHPDRNCLTSVLAGSEICRIDCPEQPLDLIDGDIVLVASDGLQFLDDEEIQAILSEMRDEPSAEIARAMMQALDQLGDPDQDNTALAITKVRFEAPGDAANDSWPTNGHAAEPQNEREKIEAGAPVYDEMEPVYRQSAR